MRDSIETHILGAQMDRRARRKQQSASGSLNRIVNRISSVMKQGGGHVPGRGYDLFAHRGMDYRVYNRGALTIMVVGPAVAIDAAEFSLAHSPDAVGVENAPVNIRDIATMLVESGMIRRDDKSLGKVSEAIYNELGMAHIAANRDTPSNAIEDAIGVIPLVIMAAKGIGKKLGGGQQPKKDGPLKKLLNPESVIKIVRAARGDEPSDASRRDEDENYDESSTDDTAAHPPVTPPINGYLE